MDVRKRMNERKLVLLIKSALIIHRKVLDYFTTIILDHGLLPGLAQSAAVSPLGRTSFR